MSIASKRNLVAAALVAAHEVANVAGGAETITKPTGLAVHRFRQVPIEEDALPAQVISFSQNQPDRSHIDENMNLLGIVIEHRIALDEGDIPDDALDPYLVWSHRCIKVDETLGGLCSQITEGVTTWDESLMATGFAAARTEWVVDLFTKEDDPRQQ
jgi:hypothetical protein